LSSKDPSSIDTTLIQFQRTAPIRRAVYRQARLAARDRILDAGAGTGLVSEEIASRTGCEVVAIDKAYFGNTNSSVKRVQGIIEQMPFRTGTFNAIAFNFVILWLKDPVAALKEASRVLARDGVLLFLAEPDIDLRQDYPDTGIGRKIAETVRKTGGHPDAGSKLEAWLRQLGFRTMLRSVQNERVTITDPAEILEEADFLFKAGSITELERTKLVSIEKEAVMSGQRQVMLPLTYGTAHR